MTVQELIEQLEKIEDKSLDVVVDCYGTVIQIDDVFTGKRYFGKQEECGYCFATRQCIVLDGYDD